MNWTCPYCDRAQYLTNNRSIDNNPLQQKGSTLGEVLLRITDIVCANETCKRLSLHVALRENLGYQNNRGYVAGKVIQEWQLMPGSNARPQPGYIPAAIRTDYEEACRIRTASPKSSATLARRCLQGMIRDFCGISKARLVDEIKELRSQVDSGKAPQGVLHDSVDAIDHVRGIGNIGAHMEKDINVIVEIDPNEADILIDLLEVLFREWYVARHQRQERFAALKQLAADKAAAKAPAPTSGGGA